MRIIRVLLGLCLIVAMIGMTSGGASASPWWWAHFSRGDGGGLSSSSNMESYIGQFIRSATNSDTVYIASFTWGSGTNEPVNGANWGINRLYTDRQGLIGAAPVRVVADGDDLTEINATKNSGVPMTASPSQASSDAHNKVITLGRTAVMMGSMNWTAGGYTNQPNNILIMRDASIAQAYLNELDDQFLNSNFVENTASPQNLFTSPSGDRVEVYFSPDDQGNINITPYTSGSTMEDVLVYRIQNSTESVFYMANRLFTGGTLSDALNAAASNRLIEGWFDSTGSGVSTSVQNGHTARDWNDLSTSVEGHHKVMIFDMDIVATGSANFTGASLSSTSASANIENMVLVHDFRLARKYMTEYRRSMDQLPAENVGQSDSFDKTAPGAISSLSVTDVAGASGQLRVAFTGASSGDISRYYIFISTSSFSTNQHIGDATDNDGDGHIDEDPVGNVDNFSSGTSLATLLANDDDADGTIDEDPWMFPEAQVKSQTPSASISTIVSTANVGDVLQDNVNYWVGVVAVDKHGNEGTLSVVGPVQSQPAQPGATPQASSAFDTASSSDVSVASAVNVSVGNAASGAQSITTVQIDFGTDTNSFTVSATGHSGPNSFWVPTVSGNVVTFVTASQTDYIDPGETVTFRVAVTNPVDSGPSKVITVATTDANGGQVTGVSAGFLSLSNPVSTGSGGGGPTPNAVVTVSATDGQTSISNFSGSTELRKQDIDVSFVVQNTPGTSASVYYAINANPDGAGGSNSDSKVTATGIGTSWTATLPGSTDNNIKDGVQVRFLIEVDGETFTNSNAFYKFLIDDTVNLPSSFTVADTGFNDVTVSWIAISDNDFVSYDIYYSAVSPVTTASASFTVTTQSDTSIKITGLSTATRYFFRIQATDNMGLVSGLSKEQSALTKTGTNVTVSQVSDGASSVNLFDGSQSLSDNPAVISFTLDQSKSQSDVQVWYDVGDNPDGPGGSNLGDRVTSITGVGTTWQASISSSDVEVSDGVTVKFVFVISGQMVQLVGQPYKFKVKAGISEAPLNFVISDTHGRGFTLTWKPLSTPSSFHSYRIFYETVDTPTKSSSFWGRDHDNALYFSNASQTDINSLLPNQYYRFKIGALDEFGNVGPLSSDVSGTTTYRDAVIITEVGVSENPEFIELYCLNGPVNLASFQISDLDAAYGNLAASALTLDEGQYAVIWTSAGTDEVNTVGDANGNGHRDIYLGSGNFLSNTADEAILWSPTGDTVDAVVYRGSKLDNSPAGQASLSDTHWVGTDSASAVNAFTNIAFDNLPSIGRLLSRGKYLDTNRRIDWQITGETTPGDANRFQSINNLTLTDTSDISISTITTFSGSEKLKNGAVRLKFSAGQKPVLNNRMIFWYDINKNPDGRGTSSTTDTPLFLSVNTSTFEVDTWMTLQGLYDGAQVRFLLAQQNDPAGPDEFDEILFTRSGFSYQFTVDAAAPSKISGFRVYRTSLNGVTLTWNPVGSSEDFSRYVLFYDTAAVTSSSKQWSADQDPDLLTRATSSTQITSLADNSYWNFRVAALDANGNLSTLSDTASDTTTAPAGINLLTLIEGPNTLTSFSGAEKIRSGVANVTVTFDRSVATPSMYWNATPDTEPDGPGGNSDTQVTLSLIASNQYSGTVPAQASGANVQFVFYSTSGVVKNGASPFKFGVDSGSMQAVGSFKFDTYSPAGAEQNTNLKVKWNSLNNSGITDFKEYRIYYQIGDTISTVGSTQYGPSKDPKLSDIVMGGIWVHGLPRNDTITMALAWVDNVGNVSPLGDSFMVKTLDVIPFDDPAYDGINVASKLDGTEFLRKTDILVSFIFSSPPLRRHDVELLYNVDNSATQGDYRAVPMTEKPGNLLVYEAWIPASSDTRVVDGSTIQYVVRADGRIFENFGSDFKFKIDANPPLKLSPTAARDWSTNIQVQWGPTSISDFKTYRIRYRRSTDSDWTYIDKDVNSNLGTPSFSSLRIYDIESNANYYFNVTAVDRVGQETWQMGDMIVQRTAGMDPLIRAEDVKLRPVVAGQSAEIKIKLFDINNNAWGGESVHFTVSPDSGVFQLTGTQSSDVTTSSSGVAEVSLVTLAPNMFYTITVTSASAANMKEQYILFSLPEKRLAEQTNVFYSEGDPR